jgi:hypothetical protein
MLLALSIMKALAKSKLDRIKKKLNKYISEQIDIHIKLQKITNEHKYAIFEFYLEFYKNNFDEIKENEKLQDTMFVMSEFVLSDSSLPSNDLKNVIDFCTFALKNAEGGTNLKKITDWARKMIFSPTSDDETVRNSISSFIKMIYFNPTSINEIW